MNGCAQLRTECVRVVLPPCSSAQGADGPTSTAAAAHPSGGGEQSEHTPTAHLPSHAALRIQATQPRSIVMLPVEPSDPSMPSTSPPLLGSTSAMRALLMLLLRSSSEVEPTSRWPAWWVSEDGMGGIRVGHHRLASRAWNERSVKGGDAVPLACIYLVRVCWVSMPSAARSHRTGDVITM